MVYPLSVIMRRVHSEQWASYSGHANDTYIDDMRAKFNASLDPNEQKDIVRQTNDYELAQHYTVKLLPQVQFAIHQPWLKGYSGEVVTSDMDGFHMPRLWIDSSLK